MGNIDKFIEDMMADENFLSKSSVRQKIYRDEPIIKRASQMKNYVPEKIIQMRELARDHLSFGWSNSALFYKQAKFMEDYEDDFGYHGDFVRYYPTYQFMSDEQLRGYFSWRTCVRKGDIKQAPLSFVYMYMYELINCIGAPDPEECFIKLRDFGNAYSEIDSNINMYFRTWLIDMAVYYPIDISLLEGDGIASAYRSYALISAPEGHGEEEITDALISLSSYNIKISAFYKEKTELARKVLYSVFMSLTAHYAKNCKNTFAEMYFGKSHRTPYEPFSGAVFYRRHTQPDRRVEITPDLQFFCFGGRWYKYALDVSPARNKKLGQLLKNIDAIMREECNYPKKMQTKNETKMLISLVKNAVAEYEKEQKRLEARKINIDLSKLSLIRENALETGEKLMTEEEREDYIPEAAEEITVNETEEVIPEENTETAVPEDCPLNEDEYYVVKCLLYGGEYETRLKSKALMPSVVIDGINEKLYDMFYDTVIFFDGDTPYVPEDYSDELKEMIKED